MPPKSPWFTGVLIWADGRVEPLADRGGGAWLILYNLNDERWYFKAHAAADDAGHTSMIYAQRPAAEYKAYLAAEQARRRRSKKTRSRRA